MNELKRWIPELILDTIVAAIISLLFYLLGGDKTWDDIAKTFISAFLIMFTVGLFQRYKNNKH